ncbi:group II intron reverse transcriptase/maturase [Neobacillus drentensis]|uniref:group II intron reverse transcriptase/maturase n=1 Tax=Neobacillus drentensis TaxID=220684 RepID=UPI002FFF8CF4
MNAATCNIKVRSVVPPLADWGDVEWHRIEKYVRRLQQRIFRAESQGKTRKVRNLQRLLTRSKAALLLSIKRVTQTNQGKRTAGVDGHKVLSPTGRVLLFNQMKDQHLSLHNPKPAKRTYIPKKNGKLRPLGIPTIKDRVWQNVVKLALEPQWEQRFESISYGFRPKRCIHDAISAIYIKLNGRNNRKMWVFEGDFKGCFDNLNHDFILEQLEQFPNKNTIGKWLKAGYIDNNVFHITDAGAPQGGIVSPLLANIALHGMEDEIGVKYRVNKPSNTQPKEWVTVLTPFSVVRYADDFVVLCESKEEALSMFDRLKPYLKKRGLKLAEDKTKVTNITDGFDFLGFTIRKWETRKRVYDSKTGRKEPISYYKTIVKPSNESIKKAKSDFRDIFKQLQGTNVDALIKKLNPVIIGKANVWKHVVSKEIYSTMDNYLWNKTYKFLKKLHPNKQYKWRNELYFRQDITGQSLDKWILSSPNPKMKYLQIKKMSWTEIQRYELIRFKSSPFDSSLRNYYKQRDIKVFNSDYIASRQKLAKKQKYKCPLCGLSLLDGNEGHEVHHKHPVIQGGDDSYKNMWLVHISCHIEHHRVFSAKGPIPTAKQLNAHKRRLAKLRKMNRT